MLTLPWADASPLGEVRTSCGREDHLEIARWKGVASKDLNVGAPHLQSECWRIGVDDGSSSLPDRIVTGLVVHIDCAKAIRSRHACSSLHVCLCQHYREELTGKLLTSAPPAACIQCVLPCV